MAGMASNASSDISRKYLVKIPVEWYAKPKIFTADKICKYITFLNERPNEISAVYTKIVYNFDAIARGCTPNLSYNYSRNKVSMEINSGMFQVKIKLKDPRKFRVEKDRYILDAQNCLDIYKHNLLGLGILKFKLDKYYDNPILPFYLKVIKEITEDQKYSTYELSALESISLLG
jgi:hypothetical protein